MAGTHIRSRHPVLLLPGLLAAGSMALLGAGVGALAALPPPMPTSRRAPAAAAGAPAPPRMAAAPAATALALPAGLPAELLAPEDFGGYYRLDRPAAVEDLRHSVCLSEFARPGQPAEAASTFLTVGNAGGVPALLEVVAAYRTAAAVSNAWSAELSAVARCRRLPVGPVVGGAVSTTLQPVATGPLELGGLGKRVVVRRGAFVTGSYHETLEIAAVAGRGEILFVAELDRLPPVPGSAVYDNFGSAVVTAYGKLAG